MCKSHRLFSKINWQELMYGSDGLHLFEIEVRPRNLQEVKYLNIYSSLFAMHDFSNKIDKRKGI